MSDTAALVLDPEAQAAAVQGISVVPGWPLDPPGNAIDPLLWAIIEDLKTLPDLRVFDVQLDHYRQGYASFAEVKIARRDNLGIESHDGIEVTGFGLLLNRLAPIAALQMTAETFWLHDGLGTSGSLPDSDWLVGLPVLGYPEADAIEPLLHRYGYEIVEPAVQLTPIADGLEPDTNLGEPPWLAFDAWFYWYD